MPPRVKYTKESMLEIARDIIIADGLESLTARNISSKMGSTTAPIFTHFGSMDELIREAYLSLAHECEVILLDCLNYYPSLKSFGIKWVSYARQYPHLYEMIFLQRGLNDDLADLTRKHFDELLDPVRKNTAETFKISDKEAAQILDKMILFISGICVAIVNNVRNYTDEEVGSLISECGLALVSALHFKKGYANLNMANVLFTSVNNMPVRKEQANEYPGYNVFNDQE